MSKKIILTLFFFNIMFCSSSQNTWKQRTAWATSVTARHQGVGFTIGNYIYYGTGNTGSSLLDDIWKYNPNNDSWTQVASITTARYAAFSFTLNGKGYVGGGNGGGAYLKDFQEYDPDSNQWNSKTDIPYNSGLVIPASFSVMGKGYVTCGTNGSASPYVATYEYNPVNNSWTQKADFPDTARIRATGFGIDSFGYVGGGYNQTTTVFRSFYKFDPTNDSWTRIADYGGTPFYQGISFVINKKAYVGCGYDNSNHLKQMYMYDPTNDTWTKKTDFGGSAFRYGMGGSVNGRGYAGFGIDQNNNIYNEWWEYTPDANNITINSSMKNGYCEGSTDTIYFRTTGSFNTGNKFNLELSDANGSFSTPSIIGSDSSLQGDYIIPDFSSFQGKQYRVRVVSTSPAYNSNDNGTDFEIALSSGFADIHTLKNVFCTGDSIKLESAGTDSSYIYTWFENHKVIADKNSFHYVSHDGIFNLKIESIYGCPSSTSTDYTVSTISRPDATFNISNNSLNKGDTINFNTRDTSYITVYSWNFGDGHIDSVANPSHSFYSEGKYNVCLEVSNLACDIIHCDSITITTGAAHKYKLSGEVFLGTSSKPNDDYVSLWAVKYDSSAGSLTAVDSLRFDTVSTYVFELAEGNYLIKAALDSSSVDYDLYMPTYYGNKLQWDSGIYIYLNKDTSGIDINMIYGNNTGGPGFIGGLVSQGANKTDAVGDPLAGIEITLLDINRKAVAYTYSDKNGKYSLKNLPYGTYIVSPEVIGKTSYEMQLTIDAGTPSMKNINVKVNKLYVLVELATNIGIEQENITNESIYIFPNPANEKLYIKSSEKIFAVKVYNALGQKISEHKNQNEINISSFENGFYIAEIYNAANEKIYIRKFVKKD